MSALIIATFVWIYEEAKSRLEQRRCAPVYEITPEKPSGTTALAAQEVTVGESGTSSSD